MCIYHMLDTDLAELDRTVKNEVTCIRNLSSSNMVQSRLFTAGRCSCRVRAQNVVVDYLRYVLERLGETRVEHMNANANYYLGP